MPRALQAKQARDVDRRAVLCTSTPRLAALPRFPSNSCHPTARALEKWLQVYRTKVDLRAVA